VNLAFLVALAHGQVVLLFKGKPLIVSIKTFSKLLQIRLETPENSAHDKRFCITVAMFET
jgi:hypothetical protein